MATMNDLLTDILRELERIQQCDKAAGGRPPVDVSAATTTSLTQIKRLATETADKLARSIGHDDQREAVGLHWQGYSEMFQRGGTSKDDYLRAFDSARRRDPSLTAAKYCERLPRQ